MIEKNGIIETHGVIYLKIRCELNMDLDDRGIENVVNSLDYDIKHLMIQNTEIVDWEV